jgi:hypothetical protein
MWMKHLEAYLQATPNAIHPVIFSKNKVMQPYY